eukprot:scaffold24385_cov50-Phaeocystis_antarctica.AAC.1
MVPRREPRREHHLGHWLGAAPVPLCTWPSPPRGAPSSAGLGHGKGRGEGYRERGSGERASARARAHPRASLGLGCACPMASGAAAAPGSTHAKGSEGDGPTVGAAKGEGAAGATPLSAAPDLVTSSSATDWPVELDGGPGGSDAAGALRRCKDCLAGSDSGSDAESSGWVQVGTVSRDAEVGTVSRHATVAEHEQHDSSAPTRGPPTWWAKMAEMSVVASVGAARGRTA